MIPGLFYYDKKGENRKMNTSGEAAEQVMRMSLEGAEILIKLTGSGAKMRLFSCIPFTRSRTRQGVRND